MSPWLGLIGLVISFTLFFLRMPLAFAFGLVGFAGIWYLKGFQVAFISLYTIPYEYMSGYIWTTIPLYVLLGYFAMHSKITEEFYAGVRAWMGKLRGGLLFAIILANAAFGACCGVSIAAATAFASISLPETRKYKYSDILTLGTIAGSSNLSILIPPSFGFVLFGALTGTSISKLFVGGIFPGLVLTGLFLALVYFIVWRNPSLAPPGPETTWKEKIRGGAGMWTLVILFCVIIGGLYMGLFTPTEAAGAGAALVLLLGLVRRKLTWQGFKDSLLETAMLSAMVFFLVIGCSIFNLFLVLTGGSNVITTFISGITQSPLGLLLILSGVFLFLGTFLDVAILTVLFIPILFPVVVKAGIDPVHFGIVYTLVSCVGTISPPDGIVIYALAGIVPDVPMFTIFRAALPFMWVMIILVALLIFFPQISLFLPNSMFGG